MGPKQKLKLEVCPTKDDFDSFSWTTLDILLCSWYMLHPGADSSVLSLVLVVRGIKEVEVTAKDTKYARLRFLFPLNMAMGEGRWLRDCTER